MCCLRAFARLRPGVGLVDSAPASSPCWTTAPSTTRNRAGEGAPRFARDLIVQLTDHALLRECDIELIPVDAPSHFTDPTPTAEMVRQILGLVSQFEKASLVANCARPTSG